ncbi:MAG TPA: DUF4337 domain-containing protein [Steroidobacteraceae bacterium]|nr:DUF4337 domain-containing protein [Steroidobacteraceae bacterium]
MAEIEIHASPEHAADAFSRGVSIMVAVVGVVLAVVTIASHRAHTASVIHRTEANDEWTYYQAKKIREHLLDVASSLAATMAASDAQKARALAQTFAKDRDRYAREAQDIQHDAQDRDDASEREEARALRFDVGEGFLELGLVLSSLYFLSKRKFFPVLGGLAAVFGAAVSASNWLI